MSSAMLDLGSLFGSADQPAASPSLGPRAATPADALRLKLAVRGWVEPHKLLDAATAKDAAPDILASLACEVETAVETRPGQWYLSMSARKQELERRSVGELRAAAGRQTQEDEHDPVLRAVQLALAAEKPELSAIDSDILASLGNVCDWLGPHWSLPYGSEQIAGELAARALDADLDKMTRLPMVGAVHRRALAELVEFAAKPARARLSARYVHGGGGAGKTTLLAFLQRELRALPIPVPVVRIDFDEPAISPTSMVTLNLALCEQLSRDVPDIARRLPRLRQIAMVQRNAQLAHPQHRKGSRSVRASSLSLESVVSEAASDEGSILHGVLAPNVVASQILIILDTAELVLAQSDAIASGLVSWLGFLGSEAGAQDIRLVIAGRDPPTSPDAGFAADNLLVRLQQAGAWVGDSILLPELDRDEAAELLRSCGLDDEKIIAEAAEAVPGNPLLLRITGEALNQGEIALREDIRKAHRDSQIDPASARNYLLRRIVAHVNDPIARPYVLAATYSPVLTRAFLEEVVIPCADRHASKAAPTHAGQPALTRQQRAQLRSKAERVFRALSATHWLVRPTLDPKTVPFNRDLRGFALKLMAATPEAVALERDLRQSAAIHHLRRKSPRDGALALYHLAVLGHPYSLPTDREGTRELLRDVFDELPIELRDWLAKDQAVGFSGDATAAPAAVAAGAKPALSDAEWQQYLEGDAHRDGEGPQMVKEDRVHEALTLYFSRPTRPEGRPPTFVIQALTDLGDWDSGAIDVASILRNEGEQWFDTTNLTSEALSRFYWVTRFALLSGEARLAASHIELLERISSNARGPGLTTLAALVAVAEAATGHPIMGDRMRANALKTDAAGRIRLAARKPAIARSMSLLDGNLAVPQRDWFDRVGEFAEAIVRTEDLSRLQWVQARLERLHGQPMAEVNQLYSQLRERIPLVTERLEPRGSVLLLRGHTSEFHRPLREALLCFCGDGMAGPVTRSLLGPTLEQMSIRPAEMESETFYQRLQASPKAWCTALISYADRCRLLPSLCLRLVERGGGGKVARVANSFLAWERALCRDLSSDWHDFR